MVAQRPGEAAGLRAWGEGDQEAIEAAVSDIVPDGAAVAAAIRGLSGPIEDPAHPEETAAVSAAVESRREEFITGRWCARRALSQLGVAPGPIPVGKSRQPIWPAGHTGSISHTAGLVVAVACSLSHCRSIGIDVELEKAVDRSLLSQVLTKGELRRHQSDPKLDLATKCFSAKEALYKTLHPLTGQWLGFEDVDIEFDLPTSRFEATITAQTEHDFAGRVVRGRMIYIFGHVITSSSVF